VFLFLFLFFLGVKLKEPDLGAEFQASG